MKPDFALSLSFEGISLLHRAAGGWRRVGDVPLDVPDLTTSLADLRAKALAIQPDGITCKLIIPNDQIRYLSVETGRFEGDARRGMVEQALDGATPYPVNDLVFDISLEGTLTHVAAVARETLAEAEAFAVEHQFNPVSFVAIPGDNDFLGEPFFGPSEHASSLPDGTTVAADGIAVVVIGNAEPPAAVEPEPVTPSPPAVETPAATPDPEPKAPEETPPEPDAVAPAVEPDDQTHPDPVPLSGFSSRRGKSRNPAPALDGARRDEVPPPPPPKPAKPVATNPVIDPVEQTDAVSLAQAAAVTAPVLDVPAPALEPETPKRSGFLSRRKSKPAPNAATPVADPASAPVFQAQSVDVPEPESETERMTVFGARDSQKIGGKPRFLGLALTVGLLLFLAAVAAWASLFLEDGVAGLFRDRSNDPARIVAPDTPPADPAQSQDTPAAISEPDTNPGTAPPPAGGAPMTSTLTPQTPSGSPPALASLPRDLLVDPAPGRAPQSELAETPSSADSPVDPATPALTDTDRAVLEALSTPPSVVEPLSDPATENQTALADNPDVDEAAQTVATPAPPMGAEARYAATGIWPEAPNEPDSPSVISLSDLFVASIDRTDLSQDAIALPAEKGFATDEPPSSISSPAAAGTAFALDPRGLVEPTVEGTVTPDGITVYLGKPRIVPPATPTRFENEPEVDALKNRLAGFRPRLRPDGLVELNERAQLGGRSRAELGRKRPKLRPRNQKEEVEEEDDTPTAQAVVVSRVPKARPRDFDQKVQTPRRQVPETNSRAGSVASFAPATVKPKIPSSASVARQATLDNAINLQRVNLIGVYGSPSNRRALVRLPSGRYKKVKVGDTVDGGRITAIGDSELRYQKSGRNTTLKIPSG